MGKSILEFLRITGYLGWVVIVDLLGGSLGAVQMFRSDFSTGWVIACALCSAIFVGVMFFAFHKMRLARDEAIAELNPSGERGIADLCSRLDALGEQCGTSISHADIQAAMAAGSVVKKLRDLSAFRADPVLEEMIDTAMRRQLIVQMSRDHPNSPAAQGEYQTFWVAREAAAKRVGQIGHVEVSVSTIKTGCTLIADEVRREWGLAKTGSKVG